MNIETLKLSPNRQHQCSDEGFTLIELLIVMLRFRSC
jgi:competence protein ComGC